jgi:hypothetical protein
LVTLFLYADGETFVVGKRGLEVWAGEGTDDRLAVSFGGCDYADRPGLPHAHEEGDVSGEHDHPVH